LEAAPRDASLWQGFGGLMMRLRRAQDAAAAFQRAGALAPGDAEIALDRGRAALALGRPVEALQLVAPLGSRAGALSVRARAATALGERDAALEAWRRLFAAAPCHPGAAAGLLGALLYDGEDAGEIRRVARAWGAACAPVPTGARAPR